jgi:hypothetical protein
MTLQKIFRNFGAYFLWFIVLALGTWLALLGREVFLGSAAKYYAGEIYARQTLVRFFDRAYVVVIGLAWLSLMIVSEELFRRRAAQGNLFPLFSFISGIELIVIFCLDLTLLFLQNWVIDPLRLLILGVELIAGIGLIIIWRNQKTLPKS